MNAIDYIEWQQMALLNECHALGTAKRKKRASRTRDFSTALDVRWEVERKYFYSALRGNVSTPLLEGARAEGDAACSIGRRLATKETSRRKYTAELKRLEKHLVRQRQLEKPMLRAAEHLLGEKRLYLLGEKMAELESLLVLGNQ
jgi:hypothetical protein